MFVYKPLSNPRDSIRLLRVVGEFQVVGVCLIMSFHIDGCLPYLALSYAWDSQAADKWIWLDGKKFDVMSNLHDVLGTFCAIGLRQWVWIDTISVDQNSDAKKSQQVQPMPSIYKRAEKALGWAVLQTRSKS
ncbi:heterokaryon incompatibility protein-domain-containing protein [Lineolata rhizophorae]|uniref:Heterokaryon incompatibility protein-domain-containing protein n=1 Tax=Lineolata rhizophorae TaxID=578093 RepID=A0A6A6NPA2_9PEZI|nr:heterokaryon incompatibility protein-domain-containing protein [Lineolata rhizophorae]